MLLTVVLVAATIAAVAPRGSPGRVRHRVRATTVRRRGQRAAPVRRPALGVLRIAGAFAAAVGAAGVAGDSAVLVCPLVGVLTWTLIGRLETGGQRRDREEVRRELPFAVDLLATCLAAGAPPQRAMSVVGSATPGVLGGAFTRAASALELGAPMSEALVAWPTDPVLAPVEPLARLLIRAATSGTDLASPMGRVARDLASERRWRIDEVARRAGVRATAPLGLCFLPAFLCFGVVPVVLWSARSFP